MKGEWCHTERFRIEIRTKSIYDKSNKRFARCPDCNRRLRINKLPCGCCEPPLYTYWLREHKKRK